MHRRAWFSWGASFRGAAWIVAVCCWTKNVWAQTDEPDTVPFHRALADQGRILFEHEWQANDPLSPQGDGLGPMFNAKSCKACHWLNSAGGAGPNRDNVQLLTFVAGKEPPSRNTFCAPEQRSTVHPAVTVANRTTVFHRLSSDEGYEEWRKRFFGPRSDSPLVQRLANFPIAHDNQRATTVPPVVMLPVRSGESFRLSQRNTPALWGMAQIDRIAEHAIEDVAREQSRLTAGVGQGIHGRVPRLPSKNLGKFGWRGQIASLEQFVLTACAVEVGLSSRGHPDVALPHKNQQPQGIDLDDNQTAAMIEFVVSLPRPKQRLPQDARELGQVQAGEAVFHSIGCAVCHRAELGGVRGLYSDLLLHDLGPRLSDPAIGPQSAYETVDRPTAERSWRTAPLWGVADSGPWLHDGRAATLEAAILWHGGEADGAVRRFRQLMSPAQATLIAFLTSLNSPFPASSWSAHSSQRLGAWRPPSWGTSTRGVSVGFCGSIGVGSF